MAAKDTQQKLTKSRLQSIKKETNKDKNKFYLSVLLRRNEILIPSNSCHQCNILKVPEKAYLKVSSHKDFGTYKLQIHMEVLTSPDSSEGGKVFENSVALT